MTHDELKKIILDNIDLPIKMFVPTNEIDDNYSCMAMDIASAYVAELAEYNDHIDERGELYEEIYDDLQTEENSKLTDDEYKKVVEKELNGLVFKKYLVLVAD